MQLSSFSGNFIAYLTCLCDSESASKEADRSLADYQFTFKLQLSSMLSRTQSAGSRSPGFIKAYFRFYQDRIYAKYCLVGCNVMHSAMHLPVFRSNVFLPSSGYNTDHKDIFTMLLQNVGKFLTGNTNTRQNRQKHNL